MIASEIVFTCPSGKATGRVEVDSNKGFHTHVTSFINDSPNSGFYLEETDPEYSQKIANEVSRIKCIVIATKLFN
jgi:hypothetical protein